MPARNFCCPACGHEFSVPYGNGGPGHRLSCPKCGARVYRTDTGGGWGRGPSELGRGRGGRGRGPRWV